MQSFARIYMLLVLGLSLSAFSLKANWHSDLVDAINSDQEAKAVQIIEQHKSEIRTAPFANERFRDTFLHLAAMEGLTQVVNALLDAGADIQARNGTGALPIRLAVNRGHLNTVQALVERGRRERIDFMNDTDSSGYTLMHTAVSSMTPAMVRYIIDRGVDRHRAANNRVTPLDLAREHAQGPNQHESAQEIIEILENYIPQHVNLPQAAQQHQQHQAAAGTGFMATLASLWRGGGSRS